jgi:hypothetical protein
MFKKAGLSMQDDSNLMYLLGHAGKKHTESYHQYILDELRTAVKGLSGQKYRDIFKATMSRLRKELEENPDLVRGINR